MTDEAVIATVQDSLSMVRKALGDLRGTMLALRAEGLLAATGVEATAQRLDPIARAALEAGGDLVGTGVVWKDADTSGMLWWRADGGVPARKTHVDNPASDSYYDYRASDWYQTAHRWDGLVVVGPFIDAWGTDDHTLSAAQTVTDAEGLDLGVVAADLKIDRYTDRLAVALERHGDVVLLDGDDRVVVGNRPELSPGLRLEPFLRRADVDVVRRLPVGVGRWEVAWLDSRHPGRS